MKRRAFLEGAALGGLGTAFGSLGTVLGSARTAYGETSADEAGARGFRSADGRTELVVLTRRLELRHTWTTHMSSSSFRETVHVLYRRDGLIGHGEGAPIVRYRESAAQARAAVEAAAPFVVAGDPRRFEPLLRALRLKLGEHQRAAMAAIEIALIDWRTQRLGIPLYEFFGLDPEATPLTTFSIGIDTPAITRQKTREAEAYPILKVKVGLDTDEQTIAAVRSVTNKPLRVDANEGWTDKDEAIRKINWLETQGVEFIEQPMPAAMFEETAYVRRHVHLPIIADEACTEAAAIPRLAEAYDGINVKLDKSGGLLEAHRWIEAARAMKLRVMFGCMVSSSCSVTAAAHLAPLVDYADLDGNLLVANDPWRGVVVEKGKLILPHGNGLGLDKA